MSAPDERAESDVADAGRHSSDEAESGDLVEVVVEGELDDENGSKSERRLLARHQKVSVERRAPLPPIDEFRGYEDVLPGAADRILTMVEERAAHHQSMQVRRMGSLDRTTRLIVLLGAVVVLSVVGSVLVIALMLISSGYSIPGAVVGVADIAGVVVALWRLARRRTPPRGRPTESEDGPGSQQE